MTAALYPWVKAIHLASVIAFVGGTLVLAVVGPLVELDQRDALLRFNRRFTTPALAIALTAGVALAVGGQWLGDTWLQIKLACVVALFALHGMLSGRLRREDRGVAAPHTALPIAMLSALVAAIALLVVFRPA